MANKITVVYDKEKFTPTCGTQSAFGFHDKDFKKALKKLFNTSSDEVITGIEITETGITAHFSRVMVLRTKARKVK